MFRRLSTAGLIASLGLLPLLAAAPRSPAPARNDYANPAFSAPLGRGLRAFYTRDFSAAAKGFDDALEVVPDNTLALSFRNATAAQAPGGLDGLVNAEEEALAKRPKSALAHLRLGFTYLFSSLTGRNRDVDAREELNAALQLEPAGPAAHTGLGIMREAERSANRAKTEFLTALAADPYDILAREYLARIYQIDLKDPQRALTMIIDVPNLVPDYADIDFHLASLLQDLGQPEAAIGYATRGLQADVGHVGEAGQHGYTLLAQIYLQQKKLDDARRVLKASISAGSDVVYASTLLRKLDGGSYGKPSAAPSPGPALPAPRPSPTKKP